MKIHFALALVLGLLLLTAACSTPAAQVPPAEPTPSVHQGKELVETRCGTCHGVNMVEASKKDRDGWQTTVDRMVLAGAQLNDEQKVQVVDYLAVTYKK
jgi:mono/diheme cytochrome c family protein